jgi:uncharacterized protein YqfB (UPF0267 family)
MASKFFWALFGSLDPKTKESKMKAKRQPYAIYVAERNGNVVLINIRAFSPAHALEIQVRAQQRADTLKELKGVI